MIERWAGATTLTPFKDIKIGCKLALEPNCADIGAVLDKVANWLVAVSGTLLFIMLLIGGIQYLTSAGNEEQANKAKQTLTWAIVGLVVVLASWAFLKFFLERIGGS